MSKKTVVCQKYDCTQIIPDAYMIPSSVGVIKNDMMCNLKFLKKDDKQNSVPNSTFLPLVIVKKCYTFIPPCMMYSAVAKLIIPF